MTRRENENYYLALPLFQFLKTLLGYRFSSFLIKKFKFIYNLFNYIFSVFQIFFLTNYSNSWKNLKTNFLFIKKNSTLLDLNNFEKTILDNLNQDGVVLIKDCISQDLIRFLFY